MAEVKYIYGMHDTNPILASSQGWCVHTHRLGHLPDAVVGLDYTKVDGGCPIGVLNHGYEPHGTLPRTVNLQGYLDCIKKYVSTSRGCNHWVIGNEPNRRAEWPSGDKLTAEYVGYVYQRARSIIRSIQLDAIVMTPAIGPWNIEAGDWLAYYQRVLHTADEVDAIAWHTYTHGRAPGLVFSDQKMASMPHRYLHFRAYRDFDTATPQAFRHLPVFITETDQDEEWADQNTGWVQNAYEEINTWNKQRKGLLIKALCLYRWQKADKWFIDGKRGVIEDFRQAQEQGYTWTSVVPPTQPSEMIRRDDMVKIIRDLANKLEGGQLP